MAPKAVVILGLGRRNFSGGGRSDKKGTWLREKKPENCPWMRCCYDWEKRRETLGRAPI